MTKTFNEAVELFKSGRREEAWAMAQKDEGFNPEVTQEKFTFYVTTLIEKNQATEKANRGVQFDYQ